MSSKEQAASDLHKRLDSCIVAFRDWLSSNNPADENELSRLNREAEPFLYHWRDGEIFLTPQIVRKTHEIVEKLNYVRAETTTFLPNDPSLDQQERKDFYRRRMECRRRLYAGDIAQDIDQLKQLLREYLDPAHKAPLRDEKVSPNQEHYETVREGNDAIAKWRTEHPDEKLRLSRAVFEKTDLSGRDLRAADLTWADFRNCNLIGTRLSGSDLMDADCYKADMRDADLAGCILTRTNLEDAVLEGANFDGAMFSKTRILDTDFTGARNLASAIFLQPCIINAVTLQKSHSLPREFLEGVGAYAPSQATVFKVAIGSPGGMDQERDAIRQAIHSWNAQNSADTQTVFLPYMWETHAIPEVRKNTDPQDIINDQVMDVSEILIALFWWRFGTPDKKAPSRTAGEIDRFIEAGKPVHLYFCVREVPYDHDPEQFRQVQEYKKRISEKALYGTFTTAEELVTHVDRVLTKWARKMPGVATDA